MYIGRFAPSPSGPLHFGSLIAALGSYLDAKANHGQWLVRIENVDLSRERQGAADAILTTLEQLGLHWDGEVWYQHQRFDAYQQVINQLAKQHLVYACQCTRKQIQANGGLYLGHCRQLQLPLAQHAIRVVNQQQQHQFVDDWHGLVDCDVKLAQEDFILKRSDGLWAYNLAVVVDDIAQGVSHIVRGADLLEPTIRQLYLYQLLQAPPPVYRHLPLAMDEDGRKLSKQNMAPAIDTSSAQHYLLAALRFLNQPIDGLSQNMPVDELLQQALNNYQSQRIVLSHQSATSFI